MLFATAVNSTDAGVAKMGGAVGLFALVVIVLGVLVIFAAVVLIAARLRREPEPTETAVTTDPWHESARRLNTPQPSQQGPESEDSPDDSGESAGSYE